MMCFAQGRNIAGGDVGKEETPQEAALERRRDGEKKGGGLRLKASLDVREKKYDR